MKTNRALLAILTMVLAIVVAVLWRSRPHSGRAVTEASGKADAHEKLKPQEISLPPTRKVERLESAAESLRKAASPQAAHALLVELRNYLASLSPEVASAAIREILTARTDAPTRLGFVIGADGFLKEAPSLRVFLLDYLAQMDRPAAADYAKQILATKDSPDEWAVALRNHAVANPTAEGRSYLRSKMIDLLQHVPWQENPSVGYLEAFDVAVHVGGMEVTGALAGLVRQKENQAVAHAAYLALDRLAFRDGAAMLAQLVNQPELMEGREATRANYFARTQVSDPAQRAVLERYLLNPAITPSELATFTGIYPNANFMISHNLLTRIETPDGATLARQDREALQTVEGWLADPRFAKIKPQLETIRQRLQKFVAPAK